MSWLWILKLVWNRSSNSSNFFDFPSKVGIVVVRDLGSFEILLLLFLTLAELLFVANCWRAIKSGLLQLSEGCSHCEIVADLWSAPSFVFLRKLQKSSRESLLELLSPCHGHSEFLPQLLSSCRGHSESLLQLLSLSGMRLYLLVQEKSSNLDRAPKMRDSVRLNSRGSLLVTLPSISSETCVIYSSLTLGKDVFRDWPFLGCSSCVSLVTAANFRLLSTLRSFWREKCYAVMKTELVCICYSTWDYNKKCYSLKWTTSHNQYSQLIIKVILRFSPPNTFISPIYTFSLAGNIIAHTPSQGTK